MARVESPTEHFFRVIESVFLSKNYVRSIERGLFDGFVNYIYLILKGLTGRIKLDELSTENN